MAVVMGPWILIATLLSAVNVVLLSVVAIIWVRNYLTFESGLTAGLVVFAAVMVLENLVAMYFFFSSGMLYVDSPAVQLTVAVLRALQTIALAFLTYVTVE